MTPLSWAGLGFSLGTLWGLSARPSRWLVLGLLLGSLFAALFWKERKKGGILIFFLLPAFFIGALSGRERQSAASRMAPFLGNPVRLTGQLEPGSLRVRDRSVSFTLLYEGMRIPVLHLGTLPGPSWGTYTAEGCLEPIETFYNPGMVDETKRSAARKIPGRIRTQNGCLHYEGGEKDALDRIAEWGSTVRKRLSEALPPREAALLGGMLLGGSEGMDASSLQILRPADCPIFFLYLEAMWHFSLVSMSWRRSISRCRALSNRWGASFFCSATPSFAGFGHLSAEQCSLAAASCWGSCWGAGQADRLFLAFRPFCCWASIPFGSGILALPSLLRQRPD